MDEQTDEGVDRWRTWQMLEKKVDVGEEVRCWSKQKEDETHVDGCLQTHVDGCLETHVDGCLPRSYASCHLPHLCV